MERQTKQKKESQKHTMRHAITIHQFLFCYFRVELGRLQLGDATSRGGRVDWSRRGGCWPAGRRDAAAPGSACQKRRLPGQGRTPPCQVGLLWPDTTSEEDTMQKLRPPKFFSLQNGFRHQFLDKFKDNIHCSYWSGSMYFPQNGSWSSF